MDATSSLHFSPAVVVYLGEAQAVTFGGERGGGGGKVYGSGRTRESSGRWRWKQYANLGTTQRHLSFVPNSSSTPREMTPRRRRAGGGAPLVLSLMTDFPIPPFSFLFLIVGRWWI